MTIPEWIKAKRKERHMTQVMLADYAGVGLRFVRDLEQGKQTVRLDKVNQVLALFGGQVTVGEMDRSFANEKR